MYSNILSLGMSVLSEDRERESYTNEFRSLLIILVLVISCIHGYDTQAFPNSDRVRYDEIQMIINLVTIY